MAIRSERRHECRPIAPLGVVVVGATRVRVMHRLVPLAPERLRVTYAAEVDGDDAVATGEAVTADFAAVLAALKALAEQPDAASSALPR